MRRLILLFASFLAICSINAQPLAGIYTIDNTFLKSKNPILL